MSTLKELRADKQKFRSEHAKFVEICNLLGAKLRENGQYTEAISEHEIAIETCEKIKTPKIAKELEAISRRALGECFSEAGKHEQAKEEHDKYLSLAKQLNDPIEIQRAHATIGRTYLLWSNDSDGDSDKDLLFKSAASFRRALDLCQQLKSVGKIRTRDYADMKSRLLLNLALVYEELQDYEKCKKLLFESIELTKSNFLYEDLFRCQLSMGAILEREGLLDESECSYNDAYSTAKQLKSQTKKVDSLHCLGLIAIKKKEFHCAKSKFKRAYKLKSTLDDEESERLLKVTCALEDDIKKLDRLIISDIDEDDRDKKLLTLYDRLGDHYCELKCYSLAIECYKSQLEIARYSLNINDEQLGKIFISIAQTCQDDKKYDEALEFFKEEQKLQKNVVEKADTGLKICEILELLFQQNENDFDYDKRDSIREEIFKMYDETVNSLNLEKLLENENNFQNNIIHNQILVCERALKASIKASSKYSFKNVDLIENWKKQLNRIENILQKYQKCDNDNDNDDDDDDEIEEIEKMKISIGLNDIEDQYEKYDLENLSSCSSNSDDEDEETPENFKISRKRNPNQAKITKLNQFGETPLHTACISGNISHVERLIEQGAPLNAKDYCGWSPLHEACNHGHSDIAEILLKAGANIEICDERSEKITPLHDACSCGNVNVIRILLKYKANVLALNKKGETPVECLIDYKKRSDKELTLEEKEILDDLQTKMLKDMQNRGWKKVEMILELQNDYNYDYSKKKSSLCQTTVQSSLRGRNLKSNDIYDDHDDHDNHRYHNIIDLDNDQDNNYDIDKEGNGRAEYRKAMEQLSRKNRDNNRRIITNDKENKALIEKDVVRDDWLIDDITELGIGNFDKTKKRKDIRSEVSSSIKRIKRSNIFYDNDNENEQEYIEFKDYNDKEDKKKDDFYPFLESSIAHSDNAESIEIISNSDKQTKSVIEHSILEPVSKAILLSNTNSQPETASTLASRLNYLATVKFNDPERSSFALPITRQNQTISWLKDELEKRYFRKFGVKPQLTLQTLDGAHLSGEDSVLDIIQIKDILYAQIDSYTTEDSWKRYSDLCAEIQLEPETEIETFLRKCSLEHCLRLDNAFCSIGNLHSRIVFQALQRQDINEVCIKFTNFLQGEQIWECFVKLLSTLPKLHSLSLVGVTLPKGSIMTLTSLSPALRRLDLSWNIIGNEQLYALKQILTMYDRLIVLSLRGCNLKIKDVLNNQLFIQSIAKSNLDSVELDYNIDIDGELIAKFKNLGRDRSFLHYLTHTS